MPQVVRNAQDSLEEMIAKRTHALEQELEKCKQVETQLWENEARFRTICELVSDYAYEFTIDANGDVMRVWTTEAFTRITGYRYEELNTHDGWLSLVHPQDQELVMRHRQIVFSGSEHVTEYRIISKYGDTFWLRDYTRPLWDGKARRIHRVVGVAQDITAYRQAIANLQTTARRLQTVIDTVEDGITLSDERGYFEIFNARMEAITGYSKAEANACENFLRVLYPDEQDYAHALFDIREIRQGRKTNDIETTICAKDGTRKTLLVATSLIHDQDRTWFLSAYHDITRRRTIETQVLLLQNAINTTRVGVTITANDKTILYLNPAQAEMLGYAADELIGQNARLLAPQAYWRDIPFERLDAGWERETENIRKDGSTFPVHAVSTPVYDKMGNPAGVITISEDMTARKQMEAQLRAALREKEILLHELHHRVKNNMQSIASMIRLLYDRIEGPQNIDHLCECEHRIQAMALIHELLYHTKDVARLDMQAYLKQLTRMMVSTYDGCRNTIDVEIEVEEVFLDLETAIACGLLVHELVSNSLKYAFPDGKPDKLTLSLLSIPVSEAGADNDMFELVVCDNGIGLPENLDPRQADSLGFTLVMGWINQLQAEFEIERGAGTCFRIRFRELDYEKKHTDFNC